MNVLQPVRKWLHYFEPAPFIDPIQGEQAIEESYTYWRLRTFYAMYIGYASFYLTRKSFTYAMPSLKAELDFRYGDIGSMASVFAITYGISKFTSGVLGDRSNPRYFMACGLFLTGICNICFGLSSTFWAFLLCWGLNGWFQGFGWPCCARLLTHWYSQSERGRWWGVFNTSHNVGGAVIPVLAGFCVHYWGWRYALYVPGVLCIGMALFLINRMRDTPQSLGLPRIEIFRKEPMTVKQIDEANHLERELTAREILFQYVLNNPYIWLLALSYFFVYGVRSAINDWGMLFLVEQKGYTSFSAGWVVPCFECGGFLGNLVSGWCSDRLFKGRRGPVSLLFMLGAFFTTLLFWSSPANAFFIDATLMFMFGFCIFGPQMLIGLAAAELSHKKAAGTATGFVGTIAYLGAAAAGWPLGTILQNYGWPHYFMTLMACSLLSVVILIPFWRLRTRSGS